MTTCWREEPEDRGEFAIAMLMLEVCFCDRICLAVAIVCPGHTIYAHTHISFCDLRADESLADSAMLEPCGGGCLCAVDMWACGHVDMWACGHEYGCMLCQLFDRALAVWSFLQNLVPVMNNKPIQRSTRMSCVCVCVCVCVL